MPSQLLQALPPSSEFPFGKGDTVLLYNPRMDGKLQFLITEPTHSMGCLCSTYCRSGPCCLFLFQDEEEPSPSSFKDSPPLCPIL